jgi:hypothetical protein
VSQFGALETQEFRTEPIPFWLVCFSDTVKGPLRQMFFVVLLPDGTVVEPGVTKRMWALRRLLCLLKTTSHRASYALMTRSGPYAQGLQFIRKRLPDWTPQ